MAESGSLAYWNSDVYLETVSIPEDSYLLDYYRYDTAARTWEHVGTIDTGSKDAGAASGLAVAGDQLYRFRNDGQRLVDNAGSTMVLHRFDRDADAFDLDPVELSAPVGTAHVVLQAGGSTELASVIAGDMLYVWGVSRAIDERTFFRCLPLSALGMKAEGTVSEEDVPPSTVDEEEPLPLPGDPSALASTGDGAGCPLVVAAVLALVSACAVGTALRRTRTSSSDRWPRSRER